MSVCVFVQPVGIVLRATGPSSMPESGRIFVVVFNVVHIGYHCRRLFRYAKKTRTWSCLHALIFSRFPYIFKVKHSWICTSTFTNKAFKSWCFMKQALRYLHCTNHRCDWNKTTRHQSVTYLLFSHVEEIVWDCLSLLLHLAQTETKDDRHLARFVSERLLT
jgi:hypothetical protein